MSYNGRNNTFSGNGGRYRGMARGISKAKQNQRKLEIALRKIQEMEKLQEKVNVLVSERQKKVDEAEKLEEEQKQKAAAEEAKKAQQEANEKMTTLIVNVLKDQTATFVYASLEAAKKNDEKKKAEEIAETKVPKKSWFAWFFK